MRSTFTCLIREIACEKSLTYSATASDWILTLRDNEKKIHIFGYMFPCNSAVAAEIAKEKPATSEILETAGIPCIRHECFLNSAHILTGPYVGNDGSMQRLFEFFDRCGQDVVLKPLKGTGGMDVIRCRSYKQVEVAAMKIFSQQHGVAACPFMRLGYEYRAVVLAGAVKLVYKKSRMTVKADGTTTLEKLIVEKMQGSRSKAFTEAINTYSEAELNSIPEKGEIPIQWKHNLGLGLTDVDLSIDVAVQEKIKDLAIRAADAVDITFCSVDIAERLDEGLVVVEVNGGVMMDVFAADPERRYIAKNIYSEAIQLCLDEVD